MSDQIKIKAKLEYDTSSAESSAKKAQDEIKKTGKAAEGAGEDAKKGSSAFSGLGSALKGLGIISVVEGAFGVFKETLGKNQVIADLMTTAMNFLTRAFSDLIGFLQKNIGPIIGWFKSIFADPKQAIIDFGEAIQNNLIERFNSLLEVFGHLGTALMNLFKGDFSAAIDSVKEAGKEMLDVATGVDDTAGIITTAAGAIADYATETWKAAEAQTALNNSAELAAANAAKNAAIYKRLAEEQRQVRDNEFASIEDRLAANTKLGEILNKQLAFELQAAQLKVKAAQAEVAATNGNKESKLALIAAETELEGKREEIAGQRSEQIQNERGLLKEQIEMIKSARESESVLAFERRKAIAELITDELQKAETLNAIRQEEKAIELARLQANVDATTAGTQARVDAEIAFNERKQALDLEDAAYIKEVAEIKLEREQSVLDQRAENEKGFFNLKRQLLDTERMDAFSKAQRLIEIAKEEATAQINELHRKRDAEVAAEEKAGLDSTQIKQKYANEEMAINTAIAISERDLARAKIAATVEAADAVASTLNMTAELLGKNTAAGKALAIASATISTFTSAQKAYESTVGIPYVGPFLAPINAGLAVLAGVANVKKILAVQVPGQGGSGGGVPTAAALPAPVRPQATTMGLDSASIQGIGNAASGGVNRAYVLDSDIRNSDERNVRLQRAARLG
jgi:hypothetical protein